MRYIQMVGRAKTSSRLGNIFIKDSQRYSRYYARFKLHLKDITELILKRQTFQERQAVSVSYAAGPRRPRGPCHGRRRRNYGELL